MGGAPPGGTGGGAGTVSAGRGGTGGTGGTAGSETTGGKSGGGGKAGASSSGGAAGAPRGGRDGVAGGEHGGTGGAGAVAGGDAGGEPNEPDAGAGNEPSVSPYETAVLEAEPIAYWRMDIASGLSVPDASGNDNALVLQGDGHERGVQGAIVNDESTAIRFDGEASYAIASDPRAFDFAESAPFTLEAWALRETGGTSYYQHLLSSVEGSAGARNGYLLYLLPEPGAGDFARSAFEYDQIGVEVGLLGTMPAEGEWAHYVATFDGLTATLYVNGTLEDSAPVTGSVTARAGSFSVGRSSGAGDTYFRGVLDELAVYPRALGLVEVATHYALGAGKELP